MRGAEGFGPCLYCGAPAQELHHPTCRLGPDLPYLDTGWRIPLCIRCHKAEHAAWSDAGIDALTDPLIARTRRNAWFVGRLVNFDRPVTFSVPVLGGFHASLVASADLTEALLR